MTGEQGNKPTIPNQQEYWIGVYGHISEARLHGSGFGGECLAQLAPGSRVLELGCGTGNDAEAFLWAGHTVVATDFVAIAVATNSARLADTPGIEFREMRIDQPYPMADATFDAVYAHLTLHYFTDETTRSIVAEIHRVLQPGGLVMFACKSPVDPLYGKGVEIEPDMFDLNGHVRHFFSEDYARSLLKHDFEGIDVQSHRGKLYGGKSAWITAIAHKKAT